MLELTKKYKKPYIAAIRIKKEFDDNPDLSYLETNNSKDKDRLQDYYNNYWHMIGIYAETTILIPYNDANYCQLIPIRTGGLWGIESDSSDEYLKEVISNEIEQIKDICYKLHVRIPKDYDTIEDDE